MVQVARQSRDEARDFLAAYELGSAPERAASRQDEDLTAPDDGPDEVDMRAKADLHFDH